MFSFHKPKIYRSYSGCCICKAKSSSSRFTDSKKYESEFEKCFQISEKRTGDICNACVLLVKRYKKLPFSTNKNWSHVVDARAGPGTKSTKIKYNLNNNASTTTSSNMNHHKHQNSAYIKMKKCSDNSKALIANHSCLLLDNTDGDDNSNSQLSNAANGSDYSDIDGDAIENDEAMDDDLMDDEYETVKVMALDSKLNSECRLALFHSNAEHDLDKSEQRNNDNNNNKTNTKTGTDFDIFDANNTANNISSFIDMSFWKKEKICCGIIFKGPDNELLIYPKLLRPCCCRKSESRRDINIEITANNGLVRMASLEEDCSSSSSSGIISHN